MSASKGYEKTAAQFARRIAKQAREIKQLREALEASRHALVTLHGLYAHDGNAEETWRLDLKSDIAHADRGLHVLTQVKPQQSSVKP